MRYVARDGEGRIIGDYANFQAGIAEEAITEDDPEFLAYLNPPPDLAAYAAQKRWERETGGISVAGVPVHTDDRSKVMVIGARIKAAADPSFTTEWKVSGGTFVTLDAATLISIADAVLAHVDACFAVEAGVLAEITAGTITTTGQIDAAFAA